MAVTTTQTNKPFNPRGNDQSPKGYNRAALYSGKALSFDGVNDELTSTITISGAKTYCAWINADGTSNARIISISAGGYSNITFSNNKFNMYDGTNIPETTTTFEIGKWYFVVAVQEANNAKVYVNGISQPLSTTNWIENTHTASTIAIGRDAAGSTAWFDGEISGVRVFNTALTAAQVADLYNNPEKVVPTGVDNTALKLWLPMQEGAGTTAYDGSGNGNHGTISGATYTHGIGAPVSQTAVIDWNKGSNLVAYSEEFDQWTANTSSVTANDTTAPDGQTTADKWIPNSGTTSANLRFNSADIATGTDYVFFAFAKAAGFDVIELDFQDARFSNVNASFNLTNGTITATGGDNVTEGIIDKGNGWYLCYIVGNSITSGSNFCIFRQNNSTGDGSKGYYLWGAGFAQASDIVPYVKTSNVIQGSDVLLPQGLTTGRDITGVNLFENVRKQGALNLDGNSWAEVHDNASLDITDAVSVECWAYWDTSDTIASGVFGKWTAANQCYLLYKTNAGDEIRFYINGSAVGDSSLTDGWHHIVGTYDRTYKRLYIDGVQVNFNAQIAAIATSSLPLEIGRYDQQPAYGYDDQIAQPRIYNRALTAEEVARNFNSGKAIYTNS